MALTRKEVNIFAREVLEAWLRGENVLLYGPPGSGKTIIAKRAHTFLNEELPLDDMEQLDVETFLTEAGLPIPDPIERPFRAPHHTASIAALFGGNRPGEYGLALHGVLFLDELQMMRGPQKMQHLVSMFGSGGGATRLIAGFWGELDRNWPVGDGTLPADFFQTIINLEKEIVYKNGPQGPHRTYPLQPAGSQSGRSSGPKTSIQSPPRSPLAPAPDNTPLTARERERARWMVEEVRWYDNYEDAVANVLRQRSSGRNPRGLMGLRLPRRRR